MLEECLLYEASVQCPSNIVTLTVWFNGLSSLSAIKLF